ncbi:hypothetical protein AALP_AA3G200700 [Arabis alpina]|uniref:Cyclic nucleotide-binding domain-containing protein n=1 Tax=Arabis alpina TaxID=50452 RepID=A0A087HAE5_ARAAL|nr:hypothetical protein AALP_AA3G200700 [Arabis alpina]
MASPNEKDDFPILLIPESPPSRARAFTSSNRSVSLLNPTFGFEESIVNLGYTGPLRTQRRPLYSARRPDSSSTVDVPPEDDLVMKNTNLLRSGQLGMCNDPYCTTCPSYYIRQAAQLHTSRASTSRFHTALYDDARGWAKGFASFVRRCVPGIMNPHSKFVQGWTAFLAISSFFAIFIDPLFLFLVLIRHKEKCIEVDLPMTKALVSLRSIWDFIFFINILLQFRLAYVAPESRIVGAGQLVDKPGKIAHNYIRGKFFLDLLIVLPIPQLVTLWMSRSELGLSIPESEKHFIRTILLLQYIPKLHRLLPLLAGQTPTGFIFESAWANFVINLLTFMLAGHVVGSCWYVSGLQRVQDCLLNASNNSVEFAIINLTTQSSFFTRYSYSLFWGFQQISTLAGNLSPSYSEWEVYFTMGIIGLGLLLFARLIGNMHNFLQALDRRRMEMMLRRRDAEQWMSHRLLPENIRKRVREAERFNWAATRGVNEELLFENMPEDLQREIKRHLFKFLKKVRIFSLMDESILDSIRGRLKQRTYIRSSTVLHRGGLVEKMVFIVRGEMESIGEDGSVLPLSEGDVCGEELLTWCLERSSINPDGRRIKMLSKRLVSNRNVRCVTNVEAFSLSVADLEDVTSLFSRFLRSHRVQGAIRYESPYWRLQAALRIQVAWRYRKKRLQRLYTPQSSYNI